MRQPRKSLAESLSATTSLTTQRAVSDSQEFQRFEPQMNPWVAVAALAAALPPVLFCGRVFLNARRRIKEDERREQDRQVRAGRHSADLIFSADTYPAMMPPYEQQTSNVSSTNWPYVAAMHCTYATVGMPSS